MNRMKRYHLFFHKVAVILKSLKTPAIGNSWSLSSCAGGCRGLNEVKLDKGQREGLMDARFPVQVHSIGSALLLGQENEDGG